MEEPLPPCPSPVFLHTPYRKKSSPLGLAEPLGSSGSQGVHVLSTQSCLALCILPGSSVLGILLARILEVKSEVTQSCPTPCDPMDCSLSGSSIHGIFQQECWSGLPFPSPGDLPDPGIKPGSPTLQADALPSEPPGKPLSVISLHICFLKMFY